MITIAIVTRRMSPEVARLTTRLLEMPCHERDREVLVVAEDPSATQPSETRAFTSDEDAQPTPESADREELEVSAERPSAEACEIEREEVRQASIVLIPAGRGLGYNRNRAIEKATGDTIVFLDDDCWPEQDWLCELLAPLEDESVDAVMGAVRIPPSTFVGDSISALGFPGGGTAGFAVMFHVDDQGFTDHLSTLDCALRRRVFERVGGFDETMTAGSEDTELSLRIKAAGMRMRFQESAVVQHQARTRLREFSRWMFRRGRGAYQLSRRANAGPVVANRLASYRRILSMNSRDAKILAIVPLLAASFLLQLAGFAWEYLAELAPHKPQPA